MIREYKSVYSSVIPGKQDSRWATETEIKQSSTYIDLTADNFHAGGIPYISDGRHAWVDTKDSHSLIFGSTGSKKTRLFIMPLINILEKAGESVIVTDPKGELFRRTSKTAKDNGYNIVVLNLRTMDGDAWNPLALPYDLWQKGLEDEALTMLNDFVHSISAKSEDVCNDLFWVQTARQLATANLLLMMEACTPEEANIGTFMQLCMEKNISRLEKINNCYIGSETVCGMNYSSVLSEPEKTRNCTLATLAGMIQPFIANRKLVNMVANNSFDLSRIGMEKTAVYIIVPDEKTTFHFLVSSFIKQAYETLIQQAQKQPEGQLPVRVNFVLDEFANIPPIADFSSSISAARSRNIRYFLVVQSMHQLKKKYGDEAETIKSNCDNWFYLYSKEIELLDEISRLCGKTTIDDCERYLISSSELQRLKKGWESSEVLIMAGRQYPIVTEIADIDCYGSFMSAGIDLPSNEYLPYRSMDLSEVLEMLRNKEMTLFKRDL